MDHLNFDDILTNHIKFGKAQIRSFIVCSFVDFLDGSETLYLLLLNGILQREWSLSLMQLILLGSIFNLGLFFGALLCGFYADRFGRRSVLIFAVFLIAFIQSYWHLILLRCLMGALYGLLLPLSQILITEITPLRIRGKLIVGLSISLVFGYLWTLFLASIFLVNLMEGNWRAIALCNLVPCFLCLLGSIFYLRESPRFLIIQGQFQEGVDVINQLSKINNIDQVDLTLEEIHNLKEWQKATFQEKLNKISIKDIFNKENLPITWRAYSMISLVMLLFSGIILVLPFLLDSSEKTILDLSYTVMVEIPAVLIVYLYIDQWGRSRIALIGTICTAISLFTIWFWREQFLMTGLILFKFFIRLTVLSLVPLILESYSTLYRSLGIGSSFALGRIAGFISPFIVFPVYEFDHYLPFLIGFFVMIGLMLILFTFPRDLTQKPLDQSTYLE